MSKYVLSRQLPFPTRKPSFKEVKRVFQTLASIKGYDTLQDFQKALLIVTGGKVPLKTNSDVSIAERAKKAQKPPPKVLHDRAKSSQILSAGGDPCIKNHELQTPYAATPHADTRIAFRMFQAQHPDKYNYAKSQIPGPVTAEQLEQQTEKKAQQKKAKRQREKEKQVDKLKANAFLLLTDEKKKKVPVHEQRCFLCGSQLPKVPFEYDDCKFCRVPCLHDHRKIRPLNMSV